MWFAAAVSGLPAQTLTAEDGAELKRVAAEVSSGDDSKASMGWAPRRSEILPIGTAIEVETLSFQGH